MRETGTGQQVAQLHERLMMMMMMMMMMMTYYTLKYSRTPVIWTPVTQIANYPARLDSLGKSVENSTKLTCLEITGYLIKYSAILWLLELPVRRGLKV